MGKMTQIAVAGVMTMTMSAAMAANSMNGTTLSEKGMTLAVNGTASITVPNSEIAAFLTTKLKCIGRFQHRQRLSKKLLLRRSKR